MTDVLVVGSGPAGWATASACAERGLDVTLIAPHPDALWRHTYGAFAADLPADLPAALVAASGPGVAIAGRTHELGERYAVLDTAALARHLRHPAVRVRAGRAVGAHDHGVTLADGTQHRAAVVVDATGAAQALSARGAAPASPGEGQRGPTRSAEGHRRAGAGGARPAAEQTAYGVVVDPSVAARVTGGRLLFMDWRPTHGIPGWPTFLYAVPLGPDRVLLEETSLARRPGLPLAALRERLHARLRAHGVAPSRDAEIEKVRFPVDSPAHAPLAGIAAVGAAAPTVHPASGFSVTTSLHHAPRIADAVAAALDGTADPPRTAAEATRAVVASPRARLVHAMRHRGLDVLLRLPPDEVPAFFDRFFALAAEHRRAYLSATDDVDASLAAMLALFARLPMRLRARLIAGSVLGPGPPLPGSVTTALSA